MKKLFLTLMALAATMSIDAQMVKITNGDQLLVKYLVPNGGKVAFEKAPPITGSVYAKEPNCEIGWVQLWLDGPKFAVCNIGAANNAPEDYGGYYTWGGKNKNGNGIEFFDDHNETNNGSKNLSGTDDTATYLWGDNWRMPTKEEFEALVNNENCTCTWTDNYNGTGVTGLLCAGKEGTAFSSNSVFLPAAGHCDHGGILLKGVTGLYWSSVPNGIYYAYDLHFNSGLQEDLSSSRSMCFPVRAVLNEAYATDGNER